MDNQHNPDNLQQNRDILREMASINQQAQDRHTFKKTTNWRQQSENAEIAGQADQIKQIIQSLNRIEEKLNGIEKMLKI